MARSFLTSCEAEVKIKIPEFNVTAHIFASFHATSQKMLFLAKIYYGKME